LISRLFGGFAAFFRLSSVNEIAPVQNDPMEHYTALEAERNKRICKSKEVVTFIAMLKKQSLVVTEWYERLWITLLDTATVFRDGRIVFRFKNRIEITT
jgi:hypothetical protein